MMNFMINRIRGVAVAFVLAFTLTATTQAESFEWSGYRWQVRTSNNRPQGPGPNLFSDSKENVFVDDDGNLHLRITKNDQGKWVCAEASIVESLGYGTYEWELSSRYDTLASNAVVGLFTYSSPENIARQTKGVIGNKVADTPHEIDIEFTGAWGDANVFYTSHDPDIKPPSQGFYQALTGDYTTHRFTWKPDSIHWESFNGHVAGQKSPSNAITEQREGDQKNKPATFTYQGPVVPKDLDEKVIVNFWLFDDKSEVKSPTDGKPQEIIIHSFQFTPLENSRSEK
jgi:hypothetical protein